MDSRAHVVFINRGGLGSPQLGAKRLITKFLDNIYFYFEVTTTMMALSAEIRNF